MLQRKTHEVADPVIFFFERGVGSEKGFVYFNKKFLSEALVVPWKVKIKLFTTSIYFLITFKVNWPIGSSSHLVRSNWSFSLVCFR